MKLMPPFYLCLLIVLFMQNEHFNGLNSLQKVVPTSVEGHSKSSQEICIAFAQIAYIVSPLPGTTCEK